MMTVEVVPGPWRKFTLLMASAGAAAALAADSASTTPADAAIVPKVIASLLGCNQYAPQIKVPTAPVFNPLRGGILLFSARAFPSRGTARRQRRRPALSAFR